MLIFSSDPNAAAFDKHKLSQAVHKSRLLDNMHLAISVVAPYVLISYIRYTLSSSDLDRQQSDLAFSEAQQLAGEKLVRMLVKLGLRALEHSVANLCVPDVETDLRDLGEATVADCLFFG